MTRLKHILFLSLLLPTFAFAQVTEWKIIPDKSKLGFTATQNGAPVAGQFKKFTGVIVFSPDDLASSHVNIIVDMASVTTAYTDLTTTLLDTDWFNTKLFPQAVFDAKNFKKTGDNEYQANGTLTVRDKTSPVTLTFKGGDFTKQETEVSGSAQLNRSTFGVGQGEWASTDEVKDPVTVTFTVNAKKN